MRWSLHRELKFCRRKQIPRMQMLSAGDELSKHRVMVTLACYELFGQGIHLQAHDKTCGNTNVAIGDFWLYAPRKKMVQSGDICPS